MKRIRAFGSKVRSSAGRVVVLIAHLHIASSVFAADPPARVVQSVKDVVTAVAAIAVSARQAKPDTEGLAASYGVMGAAPAQPGLEVLAPLLRLYRARCLRFMGNERGCMSAVREGLAERIDVPDFLMLHADLTSGGRERNRAERFKAWDELGRILPVSIYGRDRDDRLAPAGKIDPAPPYIPVIHGAHEALGEIAALYRQMGLRREAIDANLQALYTVPNAGRGHLAGKLWLRVGDLELLEKQPILAVRAYLKAAYANPKQAHTAAKGVVQALAVTDEATIAPRPSWENDSVATLVALYMKLHLHPLALRLLRRVGNEAGHDTSRREETVRKEWLSLLRASVAARGPHCYVLGYDVSEVGDWGKVRVLHPSDTFWIPRCLSQPAGAAGP